VISDALRTIGLPAAAALMLRVPVGRAASWLIDG